MLSKKVVISVSSVVAVVIVCGIFVYLHQSKKTGPSTENVNESTLEFENATQVVEIITPAAAYAGPSKVAPEFYQLVVGTQMQIIAKSKDGAWCIAMTADGKPAFIPSAAISQLKSISGRCSVLDTADLNVNGVPVVLNGITGEGGDEAKQLQTLINAHGGTVSCTLVNTKYRCEVPGMGDIARASLFNGGARPDTDASDDYKKMSKDAQEAHKGIWK